MNEIEQRKSIWEQLVDQTEDWVGGILRDSGDLIDRQMGGATPATTEIVGMRLFPNGDAPYFEVIGKDFDCGGSVKYLGISGNQSRTDQLCLSGYGGHSFVIQKPSKK